VKVLFVDLETEWRGGQNQALLLLKALNARGDTMELVATRGSALAKRANSRRIKVHQVLRQEPRLAAALKIFNLTRDGSFDVVHANEAHGVTAAWLAGAQRHAGYIISRRVGFPIGKSRMAQARYQSAAKIVAISNWVAQRLVESGAPKDKLTVVYEGVDIPQASSADARQKVRARCGVADDAPLLGSVGALLPDKGHEFLIRAMTQLRHDFPGGKLLLVGNGPLRPHLEALAKELGVGDMVVFSGFITEIEAVYPALDVFLFPSSFEGLGTALLSAMSHGVPSVAFDCCAFGEIIETGKNGILVEKGSLEALTGAAKQILLDRHFALELSRGARQRIHENFSSERMIAQMSNVYHEVASRRRPEEFI
jgi:glycosyltransferase involved in cell wall biosynthesis